MQPPRSGGRFPDLKRPDRKQSIAHFTENEQMNGHPLSPLEKALRMNQDAAVYGTFAEIGAGQEVVRWFFHVDGATGTFLPGLLLCAEQERDVGHCRTSGPTRTDECQCGANSSGADQEQSPLPTDLSLRSVILWLRAMRQFQNRFGKQVAYRGR